MSYFSKYYMSLASSTNIGYTHSQFQSHPVEDIDKRLLSSIGDRYEDENFDTKAFLRDVFKESRLL